MKKMICILTMFIFFVPYTAFAHTYLKESIPQNGEVVEEALQEIELVFDTRIENQSRFELTNEQGATIALEETIIEHDLMRGRLTNPLENGIYTVTWNIIGADGHPITGEFSFEVNAAEALPEEPVEEEPAAEEEMEEGPEGEVGEPAQDEQGEEPAEQADTLEESNNNLAMTLLLVIIVLGAAVSLWFVFRRKKV